MFKKLLIFLVGAGVVAGATAGATGFVVLQALEEHDAATQARDVTPPPPPDRTDEVLGEVGALRDTLAKLAEALDANAEARDQRAEAQEAQQRREVSAQGALLARLEQRLGAVDARLGELATALERARLEEAARSPAEAPVEPPAAAAEPAPEPAPVAEPAPEPEPEPAPRIKRRSLAELLAERKKDADPRDRVAEYALVKGYCRVGFDGGSTVHNFTARSDALAGAFRLHLRELADGPGGALELKVDTLKSGNDSRDEEIHRNLGAQVRAEVLGFKDVTGGGDAPWQATARLRFTIGEKAKEYDAPVTLEFARQRLHVKGEAKLKLSDFDIHPSAKLGVIKVYDDVTAWWDLYAEPARDR